MPTEIEASASDSSRVAASEPDSPRRERGRVQILEVYGKRALQVGEETHFRIRLAPGFSSPLQYTWDFGDGILSVGNNVTYRYAHPGRYTITVIARNDVNSDTAAVSVTVTPAPARPAPPPAPVAADEPFQPGDIVWVAGIYPQSDMAGERAAVFTTAGLRAAVLPTHQGEEEAYLVAVGGYRTEAEAMRAQSEVLQAQDTPLWLLQLDARWDAR